MKHLPFLSLLVASFISIMAGKHDFGMTWHCNWVLCIGVMIGVMIGGKRW